MYVCWDVHQDTYLDIWVGRVIIIKCQDNNLLCCSTTWLFHLSRHNCFHQVLLRISGFMIIILYSFMSCLSPYILFHQSPALVVLYYVLIYARHLAFVSPLAWGVLSDSPGSSCPGLGAWSVWISPSCWSEWRSGSVDLQQIIQSSILPGPLCASRVFFCTLVSAFCTVHTCTSLVISQLRISVM